MRLDITVLSIAALFVAPARGGVTTATVNIGGPGGFTSCGNYNPPTLCDGTTLASATVVFTYDATDVSGVLTLEVTNTSPVEPGVPNPLLTELYFNTPAYAVTGLALLTQSGAGGASPSFDLVFDPDLHDGQNRITADGFGGYNARLRTPGGNVQGAIANAAAGTIAAPPGSWVVGPATFTFEVIGPVSTITAENFAKTFSVIPPGSRQANVVGKFQAGGLAGESGFITNAPDCKPGAFMIGEPRIGCRVDFVMTGQAGCNGCLVGSDNPGPICIPNPPFGTVCVPVGDPTMFPVIVALSVPPAAVIVQNVQIPMFPALVGEVFYFANVLLDVGTGQISVSAGFTVTILPAGPCS